MVCRKVHSHRQILPTGLESSRVRSQGGRASSKTCTCDVQWAILSILNTACFVLGFFFLSIYLPLQPHIGITAQIAVIHTKYITVFFPSGLIILRRLKTGIEISRWKPLCSPATYCCCLLRANYSSSAGHLHSLPVFFLEYLRVAEPFIRPVVVVLSCREEKQNSLRSSFSFFVALHFPPKCSTSARHPTSWPRWQSLVAITINPPFLLILEQKRANSLRMGTYCPIELLLSIYAR